MNAIRTLLRPYLVASTFIGLVGCSSQVPMSATFKQARGSKVAVMTMRAPTARVMQQGGQGLLDMAINQATSSGRNHRLEDYPSQAQVNAVGERFASRLNSLGYKATLLSDHPTAKEFNHYNHRGGSKKPLPGADSYLQGYDYLLVIDMPAVGQIQLVYGFIPLSDRRAAAALQGSLLSCLDGKPLWRSAMAQPNYFKGKATEGSSAETGNLYQAIDKVIEQEAGKLEAAFFSGL